MNSKVIKRMMKFKITVHHTKSTNSLGDKTPITFDVLGYFQEDIKLVLNRLGRQETSGAQVYLTGADILKVDMDDHIDISVPVNDSVTKAAETDQEEIPETQYKLLMADLPILRKDVYYKPDAQADVGVLYLP